MSWTYPSKGKWANLDPSSNALVQVGPGRGFASLFVPSQWWVPPETVVTLWPRVRTFPSKMVLFNPSIRKLTKVRWFWANADESTNPSIGKLTEIGWFGDADESKASTATMVKENKWWSILLAYFVKKVESTSRIGSDWEHIFWVNRLKYFWSPGTEVYKATVRHYWRLTPFNLPVSDLERYKVEPVLTFTFVMTHTCENP